MAQLSEVIHQIAEDYMAFTGKSSDWKQGISLKEYGLLRKMAYDELSRGEYDRPPERHTRIESDSNDDKATASHFEQPSSERITKRPAEPATITEFTKSAKNTRQSEELSILLSIKEE